MLIYSPELKMKIFQGFGVMVKCSICGLTFHAGCATSMSKLKAKDLSRFVCCQLKKE